MIYLLYILFPIWLVAGLLDYWCHRRSDIERTSGLPESRLHVLQALQLGVPLFAALFLEINALVLAVIILCVLAHSATSYWDVSYTISRRYISPFEQHVHSYLDVIPLVAALIIILLHRDQFLALLGAGPERASFSLRAKAEPLPAVWVTLVTVSVLGVQGVALLEEFWRTWRHASISGART